jgi:coenzyme F420-reducing hydrogenase alpha subunit
MELGDNQQDELIKYIKAIISTAENGVDLMNKVTHDLSTNFFYVESCVIGVVTSIGLIKLVHNISKV